MRYSMSELSSWDLFFYYGQNELDLEIEADLVSLILQPSRSMYYNNQESGGIAGYENYPNDLYLQVNGRFDIVSAIAWKNRVIADGDNGLPDRRIAVSQNFVTFERPRKDELNLMVFYIPYYNYNAYNVVNPSISGQR